MIDLFWIIEEHFPHMSPAALNRGWCYKWAWIAKRAIPHARLWVAHDPDKLDGDHAFVQIDDRWYDAEHPKGVSEPKLLTFFLHLGDEPFAHQEMDDFAFKRFWE